MCTVPTMYKRGNWNKVWNWEEGNKIMQLGVGLAPMTKEMGDEIREMLDVKCKREECQTEASE